MHKNLPVQPRRMWSDWSDCSAECKKTRHRLFCDDLLAAQQQQPVQNISASHLSTAGSQRERLLTIRKSSKLSKRQTDKLELQEDSRKQREELLLAPKVNEQLDDEDYADEGDEEGDTDTCDKVSEREKTFELMDCQGGLCRPSNVDGLIVAKPIGSLQPNGIAKPAITGTTRQLGSRQKEKQERVFSRPLASTRGPNLELQTDPYADMNHRFLAGADQQPAHQLHHLPTKVTSSSSGNVQAEDNQATQHSNFNEDTIELAYGSDQALGKPASGNSNNNNNSSSTIWRTRNMWPTQLINGDLGTQANLIQWTILIGSLLTIVLLIMLILRKLFSAQLPSYHWMLAKQTIKSSSRLDCCAQHHNPNSMLDSNRRHHHQQHSTLHNQCHNWNALQVDTCCPTADSLHQQQHQQHHSYRQLVDSNGRPHLLDGLASLQFNTDQQQLYEEPICSSGPSYTDPSQTNSNSFGRRRKANQPNDDLLMSLSTPYSYDTLPIHCSSRKNHTSADEKAFVLTRDFILSSNQQNKSCLEYGTTNTRHSAGESNLDIVYQHEQQQQNELRKHRSPNVPQQKNVRQDQDQDQLSTSRSSSISSENADESPLSIQSTTAQILSNAASSSFEQPTELGELESLNSPQQHQQVSMSATASPAAVAHLQTGLKPRHGSAAKILAFQTTVQSQPNSPMFVNQFTGRTSGSSSSNSSTRYKRPSRSHIKLALKDRSFSQDEQNESDYAMPEQTDISTQQHIRSQQIQTRISVNQVVHETRKELEFPANQCDINDRHYYEEISQKQKQQSFKSDQNE